MVEAEQRYLAPLQEQLEAMEKAIVTARGLKRVNLEAEIKVRWRRRVLRREVWPL